MGILTNNPLREVGRAILLGDSEGAIHATRRALDNGLSIENIILGGVFRAWMDYSGWYHKDSDGALERWFECYTTTYKVLKLLEERILPEPNPPFAVSVITVRGEGHILIKDILTVLLKAKGLKVYAMRRGVVMEDVIALLSDSSLKFVIISCTEEGTRGIVTNIIKRIRENRPDIKIIAGGPIAESMGADIVISDPSMLFETLFSYKRI